MKHLKTFNYAILAILGFGIAQVGFAQRNLEGTERPGVPSEVGQPGNEAATGGEAAGAAASDAGAQRPVKLKKSGVSTFFGYSAKYFYRSNPTMSGTKLKNQRTAMWTNTFYAGTGLGVIETDSSVITPYVGGSWTINDYIEGGLDSLNYDSTGAYVMLLAQYGNGWSARIGCNYASDSSTENDTEDYSEFFPNIGIMKAYSVGDSTLAIFDASTGTHITESVSLFGNDDELDNWEIAASYGLNWRATQRLSFAPKYSLSYKVYDEGINDDRDDFTSMFSLRIAYKLASSVSLDLSTAYTDRSTSGRDRLDFKNLDAGGGLSLNARF